MIKKSTFSQGLYVFLPALAMMLGWGLRGHIGGGPFGAMIPGAMVALSICLLLKLPASVTSVVVVFGVFGIGLGGGLPEQRSKERFGDYLVVLFFLWGLLTTVFQKKL